jgi:hypothetical protein
MGKDHRIYGASPVSAVRDLKLLEPPGDDILVASERQAWEHRDGDRSRRA